MAFGIVINEQASAGGVDITGPGSPARGAQDFNGASHKITGGALTTADLTLLQGHWTVEAFIRPDAISGTHTIMAACGTTAETSANNSQLFFCIVSTGKLAVFWEFGSGSNESMITTAGSALSTGTWYHVCAVKNATHVRFYINGAFVEEIAWDDNASVGTSGSWLIGCDATNGTGFFNGGIRSVKLTRGALDDATIAASAALLNTTATFPIDEDTHAIWVLGADDELDLGAGGEPDITAPEITDISPAPGTPIRDNQSITFKLTDETALAGGNVWLSYTDPEDGEEVTELIHDGDAFRTRFTDPALNTRTAISGGYEFSVRRRGGWPKDPDGVNLSMSFEFFAYDLSGNLVDIP